jgi:hypothetical protein
MARKPQKSYSGLITGIAAVLLIGVSAFLNRGFLVAKWHAFHGPTAAEIEATNKPPPPPPPPPELTATEIMEKVVQVYKDITNFSSTGKLTSSISIATTNAGATAPKPVSYTADLTLKMSKALGFRIDASVAVGTTNAVTTAWSFGNADYIQGNNRRGRLLSHADLFRRFSQNVNVGVGEIVRLFTDDETEGLAKAGVQWTREKDARISNQSYYVLSGTVKLQKVFLWIDKKTFLIAQTQVRMDGKTGLAAMDDAQIKEELKAMNNGKDPVPAQVTDAKRLAKLVGTVTDTYGDIQTNLALTAADLQPEAPVAPVAPIPPPNAGPSAQDYGGPGPGGGGRRGR